MKVRIWKTGILVLLGGWEFCFTPFRWAWRNARLEWKGADVGFVRRFGPFSYEYNWTATQKGHWSNRF